MDIFLTTITFWATGIIGKIGYWGIMGLMAIESSFIPFPSEIIIPPAAYLAQQGQFNIYLVILAGIVGSLVGALVNYCLAYTLGRKIVYSLSRQKFARFLLINQEKVVRAEKYFLKYGNISTLLGRLVPWIRQLISIPAGFSKMNLTSFIFYTSLGSGIWVTILAVLGYSFGSNQGMLEKYYQEISWFFVSLALLIIIGILIKRKIKK
jgi:membrane protein DedA with SNARE-associated domain